MISDHADIELSKILTIIRASLKYTDIPTITDKFKTEWRLSFSRGRRSGEA